MTDFSLYADASIAVLTPLTEAAEDWCKHHLSRDIMKSCLGYLLDREELPHALARIEAMGLTAR